MLNHGEINIHIYKKIVDMGLNEDITFQQFLLNLKIDEKTYILRLCYTIIRPILFLKWKPKDIHTNVFGNMENLCGEDNT